LRVLIASLAPGGAERIVLEWLGAEVARGRDAELAVLHPRGDALRPPPGLHVSVRSRETPEAFLQARAVAWADSPAPVSSHLITDAHLGLLWKAGVRTVPVVHNARPGWRNDPAAWDPRHVPQAVACAASVRDEVVGSGCRVPVLTVRHRPRVGFAATDPVRRAEIRAELGIAEGTFLVGAIGAMKAQKDHPRAVEVLAALARRRDAALVVLGGMLERAAVAELERVLDAAIGLGVADRLRLPGFVRDIEPWLAACDAIVNVSRYEGLSIGVQEALAAGLPVVASDVGGQAEIGHPALELLRPDAPAADYAARLARHPVRSRLESRPQPRAPRAWSLTLASRARVGAALDTLFVTANLNAGGAQRSLVNLASTIRARHRIAIAVCGESTNAAFASRLVAESVEAFRAAEVADDFALAESVLAHTAARGARTLCFWNTAPGVKLLVARFAPADLRLVDASPGRYAFEELEGASELCAALGFSPAEYYARLDVLVVKHADPASPRARRVVRIPNGVAAREARSARAPHPRYLVSGRIAPSKRLETICEAFATLRGREPRARLEIVGPAEPRHADYASSLAASAGPGVAFRGPGFDLAYLDEPWTAAVVLGIHQGSPNAVLEAMAAGIPVVANASGGTVELVADGETGWLLDERADALQLAEAMGEAWRNPEEATRRAAAARALVSREFTLAAMAARYLEVFAHPQAVAPPHEKMAAWIPAAASRTT
jgi:glycosyltransferase involved in cell wall biosynthesis